jgi:NTP pyrophosphatase (non-canonical NTP hydrolase)
MKLEELQRVVADFVEQNQLETNLEHRLLDLVSEVGELSKEALKASAYGAGDFKPTTAWAEELGDVLFSLICVANTSGVDLEEALKSVLSKYRFRMSSKGSPESGH